MMKYLIWLWILVLIFMLLMIPIKLLSTRNIVCPECGRKTMIKKKHFEGRCAYCGSILKNPRR